MCRTSYVVHRQAPASRNRSPSPKVHSSPIQAPAPAPAPAAGPGLPGASATTGTAAAALVATKRTHAPSREMKETVKRARTDRASPPPAAALPAPPLPSLPRLPVLPALPDGQGMTAAAARVLSGTSTTTTPAPRGNPLTTQDSTTSHRALRRGGWGGAVGQPARRPATFSSAATRSPTYACRWSGCVHHTLAAAAAAAEAGARADPDQRHWGRRGQGVWATSRRNGPVLSAAFKVGGLLKRNPALCV
jgi:hypothetical protein